MSRFTPTTRLILPEHEPDLLAGAVLDSLTRKLYYPLSWGAGTTLVLSILTLGLAPVIAMIGWLRGLIAQHEQQLWHFSEWLRLQSPDPDVTELQKIAHDIRFSLPLALMSGVGIAAAVGALAMHMHGLPMDLAEPYRFAYEIPRSPLSLVFALGLTLAAAGNWMHLAIHQQRIERFLRYFNEMSESHGLAPIPLPRLELGLRPVWLLGGVLVVWAGGLWGIPVMLAGGAHRGYTIGTSVLLRSMLAERMQHLLAERKPPIRIPPPVLPARMCVRPNCRAPLTSEAAFCPRCGTRAARLMDVVA